MITSLSRPRSTTLASLVLAALILLLTPSCSSSGDTTVSDPHSFSRPEQATLAHAIIDWDLDFDRKRLDGSVIWNLERSEGAPGEVIFDTRDLEVIECFRGPNAEALETTEFSLAPKDEVFGQALIIPLRSNDLSVGIRYRTTTAGSCVQWLSKEQTADRNHPFMFSQAQAIHARTMIPCQDTPGVRFTFTAKIKCPKGIRPVMAAENPSAQAADGSWNFRMTEPIPSYLLAIAAGDLRFKEMGARTGVWAEPSIVDKAAWEFAETEQMVEEAEKLYGAYRWGRFDLLVLPPSFPFGGMENPRLTFATPTILAGDRSLTALVAHELAHSWSGNLVTNATWADFWLNEGFTVYFERRIMEAVYGPARAEMEAVLGRQDLAEDMDELPEGDTILNVDLEGRDPDDAFSNVPYEKGYLFLRLLDESFGRERFDEFLKKWFNDHAFRSRTTQDFEAWMTEHLFTEEHNAKTLSVDAWLHEPGLPSNAPLASSEAFTKAEARAKEFVEGTTHPKDLPGKEWTTHEWLHFLRTLPEDLTAWKMKQLDDQWQLTESGNSEILMQWLLVSIRAKYRVTDQALERFLTAQGRRKFLKPLYQELQETPEGKTRALEIYRKARPLYHAIAVNTIDELLQFTP